MHAKSIFGFLGSLVLVSTLASAGEHDCYSRVVRRSNPNASRAAQCQNALADEGGCRLGTDYRIESRNMRSDTTVFAIHGGDLEYYTDEVAKRLGQIANWNYYAFIAEPSAACLNGRSTSDVFSIKAVDFYEDTLVDLLQRSSRSVMIGGYATDPSWPEEAADIVCVGGKNGEQAERFVTELNRLTSPEPTGEDSKAGPTRRVQMRAILMKDDMPMTGDLAQEVCRKFSGADERSIVNQNARGAGLQIYFSKRVRKLLGEADAPGGARYMGVIYNSLAHAFSQ